MNWLKKLAPLLGLLLIIGVWAFAKIRSFQLRQAGKVVPTLHLYAMSNYFPSSLIKQFEELAGCRVGYDNFSSNEELLAKLQAGASGYDIIIPSDYIVPALIHGKLLRSLEFERIPNRRHLAGQFTNLPFDPNSTYTIPYTWGTTGLIYNSKFVTVSKASWKLLMEKAYAKRMSLLDDEREVLGAMLLTFGHSPNSTDYTELLEAQGLLKLIVKQTIRLFASDPKQHLYSGDIWIAHIYSGDARQVMKVNHDMRYIVPEEGAILWTDVMAIPSRATNPELAHRFINFVLEGATAKELTETLQYSSPNQLLETLIDDPSLKPSYLKQLRQGRVEYLKDLGAAGAMWDQLWTTAKSR